MSFLKKSFFNWFIKICKGFCYRLLGVLKLVSTSKYYNQPSYFLEYASERKSSFQIFLEQLWNVLKYGFINDFYFAYGFEARR